MMSMNTLLRPGLAAITLALAAASAPAATKAAPRVAPALEGTVTEVYDAQTLQLTQASGQAVEVRLADIEVPEPCQTWGPEARDALKDWVMGRQVRVTTRGAAGKGRVRGVVLLEGANVNANMVSEGHAWSVRTRWDQGPFVKQERLAKSLSRGLHGAGDSQTPKQFRATHAPCAK
jgi:endonuclease YncB( thermonuclease family)